MSKGEDSITARAERIQRAKKMCDSLEGEQWKRVIDIVAYNLGIRTERAREYMSILVGIGFIKSENGTLKVVKEGE